MSISPTDAQGSSPSCSCPSLYQTPGSSHGSLHLPHSVDSTVAVQGHGDDRSPQMSTPGVISGLGPRNFSGSKAGSTADSHLSSKKTPDLRRADTKKGSQVHKNRFSSFNRPNNGGTSSRSRPYYNGLETGQVGLLHADIGASDSGSVHEPVHSAARRSHMVNGNHLLNFQYLPISRPRTRVNTPRKPRKIQPYSKDLFLQANFKFVVLDSEGHATEYMDPDKMLRWEDVVCVRYSTPSPVQCPICLECPLSPQITSCGHIFCFPCILRYLLMGEEDHRGDSWKKCPLCFTMISSKDLCTIYIYHVKEYRVGDLLEFTLLTRAKDSLVPSEKAPPEVVEASNEFYDIFSKFTITTDVELSVRGAEVELNDWLAKANLGLVEDMEQLPYVCAALEQLEHRKNQWEVQQIQIERPSSVKLLDHANVKTCNYFASEAQSLEGSASRNGISPSDVPSTSVSEQLEEAVENKNLQKLAESCKDVKESYTFYQAVDGQLLILHPLNMKCLLHHFGSHDLLPSRICGKILQLESVAQSEAMRRRYRYLSHFPLTTTFQLCEIDLSDMLPSDALTPFLGEIKKRHKERIKSERKENEAKAKATAMELLHMPSEMSSINDKLASHTGVMFSIDDFEALGGIALTSTSPPISGDRKRFADVTRLGFAAAHDSPSLTLEKSSTANEVVGLTGARGPTTLSFANVMSTAKTSNLPEGGKKVADVGKKGKKPSRVLLSTAGGRRY